VLTDQDIEVIGGYLRPEQARLTLKFSKCPGITDNGIRFLIKIPQAFFRNLRLLTLILEETQVTNQMKDDLKKHFSFVPQVHIN